MIELREQGYDSATSRTNCDWCGRAIGPGQPVIIYGTGNSLLVILHPECDPDFNRALGANFDC